MPAPAPLVEIDGLAKTYRRSGARALAGVDLAVPEGAVFGLLGPNGAGKSTLLAILLGLTRKDAGAVRIAGRDLERELPAIRRLCGLAPQELGFYPTLTVEENLRFYAAAAGLAGARRRERIAAALAAGQLEAQRSRRADALSGGLKRRLNLSLALLQEPRLLFLDEPTVGVDPQSRAYILEVVRGLRARGTTVVYTSHYMDEVQQVCDRVAILDQGRVLAQGPLQELLDRGETLRLTLAQALSPEAIAAIHAVHPAARCAGHELSLEGAPPLAALAALQPVLEAHRLTAIAVRYGHADLEELFLHLTHRRLRD